MKGFRLVQRKPFLDYTASIRLTIGVFLFSFVHYSHSVRPLCTLCAPILLCAPIRPQRLSSITTKRISFLSDLEGCVGPSKFSDKDVQGNKSNKNCLALMVVGSSKFLLVLLLRPKVIVIISFS